MPAPAETTTVGRGVDSGRLAGFEAGQQQTVQDR